MTVNEKIAALRSLMKEKGLSAYIIPSTDPHISEYAPAHWLSRAWISGFTGSVATVVITMDEAGLWTDGRYFLQADEQLAGTEVKTFKLGLEDVPDFTKWINDKFGTGDKVGFDGKVFSVVLAKKLVSTFKLKGIEIESKYDLISEIWEDRPGLPGEELFEVDVEFTGQSRVDKIGAIRDGLRGQNCDYTLLCSLDDVCWAFNIRGYDVPFNPVLISYALISMDRAILYVDKRKLPSGLEDKFKSENIEIREYSEVEKNIKELDANKNIYIDPSRSNYWLYKAIPEEMNVVVGINISTHLKAIKNEVELNGVRNAMRKDCLAMIDNWMWMEEKINDGGITELSVMEYLESCRAKQEHYYGLSFNTIAGMGEHGAIIHYGSTEKTSINITDRTFFLLDSGAQFYDGTTDITRTYHFGKPTEEEKEDYTQVLMGHIDLTLAKFPVGTRGSQLDVLARKYLWDDYKQYHHGTGHGVGCFMNVHEGPQSIRMDENSTTLKPGMIVSNEPGLYRAGKHGIRIENLITVKKSKETEFAPFLEFENLTLFPIETKAIKKELMSQVQIDWLNDYHRIVFETVSPMCNEKQLTFLKNKIKAI